MSRLHWREDPQGGCLWLLHGKQHNGNRQRIIKLDESRLILTWCNDLLGKSSLSVQIDSPLSGKNEDDIQWKSATADEYPTRLIFVAGAVTVSFAVQPTPPGLWEEVDPHYIYSINAVTREQSKVLRHDVVDFRPIQPALALQAPHAHEHLRDLLTMTVRRHIKGEVANIFFSGGVDSTILAAVAASIGTPTINLWNVSFAGAEAPDRLTSLLSYAALSKKFAKTEFNYYARDVQREEHSQARTAIMNAIYPKDSLMDFTIGSTIYFASQLEGRLIPLSEVEKILRGFDEIPIADMDVQFLCCRPRAEKKEVDVELKHCQICAKYVRKNNCAANACGSCCKKIGLDQKMYLCKSHGVNKYNNRAARGMRDSEVEKRLSALWPEIYRNSAPTIRGLSADGVTVLCGNGADELFGGYSRYSTCEMHGGLEDWRNELVSDLDRLWIRNFARDDRVILASSGGLIECHLPFFELEIIEWVKGVSNEDLWHGVVRNEEFANNKALLREMCRYTLGLEQVAVFKKRAMQFGSRSAMTIFAETDTSRRSQKGTSRSWFKKKQ